jgi:peptidoglycan-associated lipoprotein
MTRLRTLMTLAICVSLATACARAPQPTLVRPEPSLATLPSPTPPPPFDLSPPPTPPAAPSDDELFARKTLAELNAEGPLGAVYFDYDHAALNDEARATLTRNADWMHRFTSTHITVEGHCDERGTAEYNLALGDRRAEIVRGYLASLGIAAYRVTAVSKGKEAPVCTDADESCWRQNRRGAPIITAK